MFIIRIIKKFNIILSRHQKKRIIELIILMVVSGFLEMLSVTLVLPFMQVVTNPESMMDNRIVTYLCDIFKITNSTSFLVYLSIILAVGFMLKNILLLWQLKVQKRFVYTNMFMTEKRILHNYLARPYEYYLSVKSGEIIRIINDDISATFYKLTELLQLFSESIVSGILIITVFVISPTITITIAIVLFLLVAVMFYFVRPIQKTNGENNKRAIAGMNQWLMQSIQGIKEIKVLDSEDFFEQKYNQEGMLYVESLYKKELLQGLPKYTFETIMMGGFFVFIAFWLKYNAGSYNVIPIISVIALAAVRILPSVNMISSRLSLLAYGEPVLDKMIADIKESEILSRKDPELHAATISFEDELLLENVSYYYPNSEERVLNNASLSIKKGSSIGIVGTSGSGKTTTIDVLLGLLRPIEGSVKVDGVSIFDDIGGYHRLIGYIPQSIFIIDGSIKENVAFGVDEELIDEQEIWKALKGANLDDVVKHMPEGINTELGERGIRLSGGQIQRIGIARALYRKPQVLVLDEATSALDNNTEAAIMEEINELKGNMTIIIIAHRLSTIDNCDYVYRVENGKLYNTAY